jgi:hypothetical protein
MALLRKQIESLRCKVPNEDRYFIPHRPLYELLTREVIFSTLKECEEIRHYHLDETVEKIVKGGRRIFAVLVLLKGEEKFITRFLKYDQFQRSSFDLRLPFPIYTLESIIPTIAADFHDMQWELVAPIFSRNVVHRFLDERVRLPFLRDNEIGEGGFGTVFEVRLHPDHQMLPLLPNEAVSYSLPLDEQRK